MDYDRLIRTGAYVAIAYVLGFASGLWYASLPLAPIGEAVLAKPDPALRDVGTETIPCAPVQAYRPAAKKKLALPPAVQDNSNLVVTSSIGLKPDINPHRLTGVFDKESGKTEIYDQRLALPWLALDTSGEAGISYGQRGSDRIVRFEVRQSLADIKAVRIGAVASFDQSLGGGRSDGYIGVGGWYRW